MKKRLVCPHTFKRKNEWSKWRVPGGPNGAGIATKIFKCGNWWCSGQASSIPCHTEYFKLKTFEKIVNTRKAFWPLLFFSPEASQKTLMWEVPCAWRKRVSFYPKLQGKERNRNKQAYYASFRLLPLTHSPLFHHIFPWLSILITAGIKMFRFNHICRPSFPH